MGDSLSNFEASLLYDKNAEELEDAQRKLSEAYITLFRHDVAFTEITDLYNAIDNRIAEEREAAFKAQQEALV
jgi:flagellar biosynthesis chaperone FliJ